MQSDASVVATTVLFIAMAVIALIVIVVVFRAMWDIMREPAESTSNSLMTAEDEGNAHSGPHGYTGGAYPETQYGSGFNPNADWNEAER